MGIRRRRRDPVVADPPADPSPSAGADELAELVEEPANLPVLATSSVTAAVSRISLDGVSWKTWKFGDRAWQKDAWRLYDLTGQLRFIANWVGNSVARCRLRVAKVDETGEAAEEATNPAVASLAAGPLGRGPAKDEALRLLGTNLFIAGEAYIVAEAEAGPDREDQWWVVSGRQIKRVGDVITVRRSQLQGGGKFEYEEGKDLILRCWTPHPADTDLADSPTRSAIPDLRELEAIRKREFAELDSRLTGAGLLVLPEGCDFPRGPDDPPGVQGFTKLLQRAMGTSLVDRASAEAMVPIMFTAPGDLIDKIKLITFWSELSDQLLPLRKAAIESLAQSLDIPPEVLLGLGSTNHWSAWAISEEAITTQIKPVLARIADALTVGYLRGALEILGEDPDAYCYDFDTSPLTVRPNRAADALNYHDHLLLSDEEAIQAGAWPTEALPSPEERLRRIVEKAVMADAHLLADPWIREVLGVPASAITIAPDDDGGGGDDGGGETTEDRAIPEQQPQSEQEAAILAVAKMATVRAMSLAGGRLVAHRHRDRWPDTPRHQLNARHGPVTRERATEVLRGAWDELPMAAADLRVDADAFRELLDGFCVELLARGMTYDPGLLRDLLAAAVPQGRLACASCR